MMTCLLELFRGVGAESWFFAGVVTCWPSRREYCSTEAANPRQRRKGSGTLHDCLLRSGWAR